eukprot:4109370-Pleurochrysis_carterae.AAC.4
MTTSAASPSASPASPSPSSKGALSPAVGTPSTPPSTPPRPMRCTSASASTIRGHSSALSARQSVCISGVTSGQTRANLMRSMPTTWWQSSWRSSDGKRGWPAAAPSSSTSTTSCFDVGDDTDASTAKHKLSTRRRSTLGIASEGDDDDDGMIDAPATGTGPLIFFLTFLSRPFLLLSPVVEGVAASDTPGSSSVRCSPFATLPTCATASASAAACALPASVQLGACTQCSADIASSDSSAAVRTSAAEWLQHRSSADTQLSMARGAPQAHVALRSTCTLACAYTEPPLRPTRLSGPRARAEL